MKFIGRTQALAFLNDAYLSNLNIESVILCRWRAERAKAH